MEKKGLFGDWVEVQREAQAMGYHSHIMGYLDEATHPPISDFS